MTLWRYLLRHVGLATLQAVIVVVAMLDRHVGVGVLIGIGVSAVVSAFRDHRRQRRLAAEAAELDQRLSAALAAGRPAIDTVAEELS